MADRRIFTRTAWQLAFYAALFALLVAVVFPFYWMLKTSMDTGSGLFSYPPRLLPGSYGMEGYRAVLTETAIGRASCRERV